MPSGGPEENDELCVRTRRSALRDNPQGVDRAALTVVTEIRVHAALLGFEWDGARLRRSARWRKTGIACISHPDHQFVVNFRGIIEPHVVDKVAAADVIDFAEARMFQRMAQPDACEQRPSSGIDAEEAHA